MVVYSGVIGVLFILRYALAQNMVLRNQLYYPVIFALFVFSAFRFQVGCDWFGYYIQYQKSANADLSLILTGREPVWWIILSWVQNRGLPYPVANVISSAIFFIGVHALAKRQPDPLGFVILLLPVLIINMPMSAIRQGAAIGLLCFAFNAFTDRRPIMFTLWVFLAAGFHASALVFLLLLPLTVGRYTKARLFLAGLLSIPGVILLVTGVTAEAAISGYLQDVREAYGAMYRIGFILLSAFYFFFFVRTKWKTRFPRDYSLVSLGAIGMVLTVVLFPVSSIVADRFGYYLVPLQTMIFARLPFLSFRFNQTLHSCAPYVGLLVFFFAWAHFSLHFEKCYLPYNTWIFGIPNGSMLR